MAQGMKFPGAPQGLKMACGENPKRVYATDKKVFPSTRMGNMACYRAVQHREQEALELLKNALHLNPKLKVLAKAEPDFAELSKVPAFQKLLNNR